MVDCYLSFRERHPSIWLVILIASGFVGIISIVFMNPVGILVLVIPAVLDLPYITKQKNLINRINRKQVNGQGR